MLIRDIMTKGVECTKPTATLREAARMMKELNVGPLPVCGENDRLVGIITDRDIAIRAVAEGDDPDVTPVGAVMTPKILYCYDDQDVGEAARMMEENQVRRLVVLNGAKRLVGIVSLGDLAVDTQDEQLAGHTLEAISEPVHVH
jgi:CBS domain-containing protein